MGKISFASEKLVENASSLIAAVIKAKPAAAKGKYVQSATLCSTMGPGVPLDITDDSAPRRLGVDRFESDRYSHEKERR